MSVEQLKVRIAELHTGDIKVIRLDCDESHAENYLKVVKSVFPNSRMEAESISEAGSKQIRGRVTFAVKEPYFRALAKIGFHYYLSRSRRGYRGDEPMFDDVRRFILDGGDVDQFFQFALGSFPRQIREPASKRTLTPKECVT
jgi:hypothetical protein